MRFIAACAGNTRRRALPRAAGIGSSPRARGTPVRPRSRCTATPVHPRVRGEHRSRMMISFAYPRFIPACAGNTRADQRRVGGGNGSSPRARGTLCRQHPAAEQRRFIPACAGNTASLAPRYYCSAVHPRVRGEHGLLGTALLLFGGSSPRARGTRLPHLQLLRRASVHPRVRGEHNPSAVGGSTAFGSSPRARGTRHLATLDVRRVSVHPRVRGEHR